MTAGQPLIQAALNGARPRRFHTALPCTARELAREAAAAVSAGAGLLHIHPRGPDDRETLAPAAIAEALTAVRAAVPSVPVGVSTGDWIAPGGAARRAEIAAWTVLPDYVSVNLSEADAAEVIHLAGTRGIGVEAGLSSPADVDRLAGLGEAARCLRILVEINEQDPVDALRVLDRTLERIATHRLDRPLIVHGLDAGFWPVNRVAAGRGLALRAGLEDCGLLPSGAVAAGNGALVAATRQLMQDCRR